VHQNAKAKEGMLVRRLQLHRGTAVTTRLLTKSIPQSRGIRSFSTNNGTNPGDTDGPQPMSRYGTERTNLAKEVALVMASMPCRPRYFLDNGTLLGLWRNGELIENDDDFDFGLLVDAAEYSSKWVVNFQQDFQVRLEQRLSDNGSDMQYHSRVIDTYANKIEVYDPSVGSFPLEGVRYGGARYHHVSVDLQIHVKEEELESLKDKVVPGPEQWQGVTIKHSDFSTRGQAPVDAYEPFGSLEYAGSTWPVPGQQEKFLSYMYGYLGLGAEFDLNTRLYRKGLVPVQRYQNGGSSDHKKIPVLRLYTDMCADLFHVGHVNYLRQCREVAEEVHLIVGIHSDATIESYKRSSVCTMEERVGVVEACQYVDQVLPNAPLRVTREFMEDNAIDFVVHGTEMPEAERQAMYSIPIGRGKYTEVPRTPGISTTDLIDRIASRLAVDYEEHALPSGRNPVVAVTKLS
jgi:cytidyltransferase-like protein